MAYILAFLEFTKKLEQVSYCLQNTTLLIWTLLFKPKLDKYVETLLFQMADGHLPEVNG